MKLNTGRLSRKQLSVRIMRPWRGYAVGTVLNPPASARQVFLQAKDFMGNPVAEEVVIEPAIISTVDEPFAGEVPAPEVEIPKKKSKQKKSSTED